MTKYLIMETVSALPTCLHSLVEKMETDTYLYCDKVPPLPWILMGLPLPPLLTLYTAKSPWSDFQRVCNRSGIFPSTSVGSLVCVKGGGRAWCPEQGPQDWPIMDR
ncbi:uncharacterized protein RBU57_004166 isoform 1-T3 [Macrochelys suwanniensis]